MVSGQTIAISSLSPGVRMLSLNYESECPSVFSALAAGFRVTVKTTEGGGWGEGLSPAASPFCKGPWEAVCT